MKANNQKPEARPLIETDDQTRNTITACAGIGFARLLRPMRIQIGMIVACLDDLLPADHQARLVWDFVMVQDLSELFLAIKAVEGKAGRPAIDPRLLFALWLYATIDGVGSARKLARLCQQDIAYEWLCGKVNVNHHTLSDFRVGNVALIDRLLTENVASMMAEGLVSLERAAQDGVKVRASAGGGSFRRKGKLEEHLAEAGRIVEELKARLDEEGDDLTARQRAAAKRAAREQKEKVERALGQLALIEKQREESRSSTKNPPRASTTDPEARIMKMADGGFRPAYNFQVLADVKSKVILGVQATNSGGDNGQLSPMMGQLERRYGAVPKELLADGGYFSHEDIEGISAPSLAVTAYVPPRDNSKKYGRYESRPGDSKAVADCRERMSKPETKEIYGKRGETIEWANAGFRNRGLQQLLVRGLEKAQAVILWQALAHNLLVALRLRQK